ncbi:MULTISPECIES: hypothetical protein [Chelativorans]|nr:MULTISPECIES: hypothetical protein [Chelativorans]
METTTVEQPGTVALEPPSTVLNPDTVKNPSGGGQPPLSDQAPSVESVLEGELARLKEEDVKAEKPEAKPEKEPKDAPKEAAKVEDDKAKAEDKTAKQRDETGKFAKAEKPAEQVEAKAEKGAPEQAAAERSAPEETRQSEGRKYAEPPARFLPEARTKWANVPNEVKAEFHRVSEEFERELQEHKQFREELREYEDLAKQHNVTVKDTMARYVAADRHLNQNFGQGVAQLMQMYGHNPAQGLSAIMQALGVTPQQFAEYVTKNPQVAAAPQSPRPQAPQQQTLPPQMQELQREVQELKSQLVTQTVSPIIERFASEHPDYRTLEPQIVAVLKSGVIEELYGTGLSPERKLAEAYRIAGGNLSPSRSVPEPVPAHSEPKPVPSNDAGMKSIRGAPDDGADTVVEEAETDLRETLRKELRKLSA